MGVNRVRTMGESDAIRVRGLAAVAIAVCWIALPAAQTRIDGVLLKFGGDIITDSDVRQARVLKLVDAANDSDQAYVDALVDRRLMLAEIRRSPPSEPSAAAIDAKRRQWEARLGAGADAAALLARAGLTDAGLRGWLRDDLRIQSYLDQRFTSDRDRGVTAWLGELRRRAGLK